MPGRGQDRLIGQFTVVSLFVIAEKRSTIFGRGKKISKGMSFRDQVRPMG